MSLTPAAVIAARPAPDVPGQLGLFSVGPAPAAPAECQSPDCTDYDPCRACLAEALAAGLTSTTDPEGTNR